MPYKWKKEYEALAAQFLNQYFGGAGGLTSRFPCMRVDYSWGEHRPDVLDSRIPAKNNTEYHGLERYANQYHATAQYDFACHHWIMAAYWRREDAQANNFTDEGHSKAVEYCLKHALYNQSLSIWQSNRSKDMPKPEKFGLSACDLDKKTLIATAQIEATQTKRLLG